MGVRRDPVPDRCRPRHACRRRSGVARGAAVVLIGLVALGTPLVAQDRRRPIKTELQEQVEVRVREIPIVAVRGELEGVTDLRPEDVEVRVGGEVVAVRYLDRELGSKATDGPPPAVALFVKVGDEYQTATPRAEPPRYFLLMVDVENSHPRRKDESRDAIIAFVRDRLPRSAQTAVVAFNGELTLESPFTDDREQVAAAVGAAFKRPRAAVQDQEPEIRALLRNVEECEELNQQGRPTGGPDVECLRTEAINFRRQGIQRAARFFDALAGTVELASGLEGRPTVIAYTHGAPSNVGPELADAMRAVWGYQADGVIGDFAAEEDAGALMGAVTDVAAERGVVLHFVDPSPQPAPYGGARTQQRTAIPGIEPFETAFRESQKDLTHVAENTAGEIWIENDVASSLERLLSYEEGRYVLGVSLPAGKPGREPKVDVRSTRAGVRIVQGRVLDGGRDPADTVEGLIGLGQVQQTADPGRFVLPFRLGFRTEELDFTRKGERFEASVTLHLVVQTSAGRYVAGGYYAMTLGVPAEAGGLPAAIVSIQGGLEAPAGDFRIVAVVRNPATGAGGRLTREVAVEPPS